MSIGKHIVLVCLLMLSAILNGQDRIFPYSYRYSPNQNLHSSIYWDYINFANENNSNGDINGLAHCLEILADPNIPLRKIEYGYLENQFGILNYYKGDNIEALRHYLYAVDIFTEEKHSAGNNMIMNNISLLFSGLNEKDLALKYLEKAIELTPDDDIPHLATLRLNQVEYYYDLGRYNESLKLAYNLYDKYNSKLYGFSDIAIDGLIVGIYNKLGIPDSARVWLERGLKLLNKELDYIDILTFVPYAMEYYEANENYNEIINIGSFLFPIPSLSFNEVIYEALTLLVKANINLGDYTKGWEYNELLDKVVSSHEKVDEETLITMLMMEYVHEREQRESSILENELLANRYKAKAQTRLIVILAIAFMAALISLFIILRIRRLRSQYRHDLQEKNEKVVKINRQQKRQNNDLEKENNLLDTLISVFAHDLVNPFQSILGFSDLIINEYERISDKELTEFSSLLADTAFSLKQLLFNLKGLATIQDESRQIKTEYVKVKPAINQVVKAYGTNARKKNISVTTEIETGAKVYINKEVFQSLVRNVLSNAIKFSRTNSIVSIRTSRLDSSYVTEIFDKGVGIPPESLDKLKKHELLRSRPGTLNEIGSGLGLSICMELAEVYNGKIEIDSRVDEGTRVSIILPANAYE